jgi:hypothetical protein
VMASRKLIMMELVFLSRAQNRNGYKPEFDKLPSEAEYLASREEAMRRKET